MEHQRAHIVQLVEHHLISEGTNRNSEAAIGKEEARLEQVIVLRINLEEDEYQRIDRIAYISHEVVPSLRFVVKPFTSSVNAYLDSVIVVIV